MYLLPGVWEGAAGRVPRARLRRRRAVAFARRDVGRPCARTRRLSRARSHRAARGASRRADGGLARAGRPDGAVGGEGARPIASRRARSMRRAEAVLNTFFLTNSGC